MGGGESDVMEEGLVGVVGGVVLEMGDGGIGHRDGSVVAGAPLDGGKFHVVFPVDLGAEKPALVLEVVGEIKTIL